MLTRTIRWAAPVLCAAVLGCHARQPSLPPSIVVDLIYGPTCPNSAQVYRTVQHTVAGWQQQHPEVQHRMRLNRWLVPEDALPTPATVQLNGHTLPSDTTLPERIRGYSSPTVLVDGRNLTGVAPQPGLPGCAVQLPDEPQIRAALDAALSAP
ncbi:hypothetical protein F0P96_15645 [Hymenobacter busanensis]|uniref:Uncharacterized protein n=1 Tax=Hymenobacter busanensis TaxID=2607656 RepID=A0A7L5A0L1_9BACT|nr:hypothetical protein [Hymenobacter busanensis]KAA9331665.1 hypothetical protein F0P96_15645 [Hymenobacter busanensis]QHJ08817.1 hypothetical protein GUY19_16585 [Hymenobacter busanensis]